jgi:hypothetical protein
METTTNTFGTWTLCRVCKRTAPVREGRVMPGTLGYHLTVIGMLCEGTETTVTLAAAIARDEQLNPEERAARSAVVGRHFECKGYDQFGGPCNHTARARCRRNAERPR